MKLRPAIDRLKNATSLWMTLAVLAALNLYAPIKDLDLPDREIFADIRAGAPRRIAMQAIGTAFFAVMAIWSWRSEQRRRRPSDGGKPVSSEDRNASPSARLSANSTCEGK